MTAAGTYWLIRVLAWLYVPGFELWDTRSPYRTCNNPACAEPNHVKIAANRQESLARGREKIGHNLSSRNGLRPRPEKRQAIRDEKHINPQITVWQLSRMFCVTEANVTDCLRRVLP